MQPQVLGRLFLQKYGNPDHVGWSPRQRYRAGYYLPADIYEATVSQFVSEGCQWLDIGGGHQLFPENPALARELAARCAAVVAVDPSPNVLKNAFATERVQSTIEAYRADRQFDLVTMRMVAEHIDDPDAVAATVARLLRPGGVIVIFTVNEAAPLTIVSQLTPMWLHHAIKGRFWGTQEEDTFPVQYKMNSRERLSDLWTGVGMSEVVFQYLDDLSTWGRFKHMSRLELAAWRVFHRLGWTYPENCLLGVYAKPQGE